MAIINKTPRRLVIDLTGPQGNAFYLLGTAKNLGKQLGWTKEDIDKLDQRMTSGDYENLIEEFDKAFGHVCDLER
jgi:hypothetical protein